ncbi:hypothetical protein NEOC65_000177 [Neochlamydia sp. AcF65]|nr:hypothetical protein [Neochlamydia sp. AcF65]
MFILRKKGETLIFYRSLSSLSYSFFNFILSSHTLVSLDRADYHGCKKLRRSTKVHFLFLPLIIPTLKPLESLEYHIRSHFRSNCIYR